MQRGPCRPPKAGFGSSNLSEGTRPLTLRFGIATGHHAGDCGAVNAHTRRPSSATLPTMGNAQVHDHVTLLAGVKSSGDPVHELVPAAPLGDGIWEITGTPALAAGCAAGDHVVVDSEGNFQVVRRGGNLAIVAFAPTGQSIAEQGRALRDAVQGLGGLVESHPDGRWLVITVPVRSGFPSIERVMGRWHDETGLDWQYANAFDEEDRPLNWWD